MSWRNKDAEQILYVILISIWSFVQQSQIRHMGRLPMFFSIFNFWHGSLKDFFFLTQELKKISCYSKLGLLFLLNGF